MKINSNIYMFNGNILDTDIDMADDELSDFETKNKIKKLTQSISKQQKQSNSPPPPPPPRSTSFKLNQSLKHSFKSTLTKSTKKINSIKKIHSTTYKHIINGSMVQTKVIKSKYSLNGRFHRDIIKITNSTKSNDNNGPTISTYRKTKETIKTPSITSTKLTITKLNKH